MRQTHANVILDVLMKEILFKDADRKADFEFGRFVHHAAYQDVVTRQFGSWEEKIQDSFHKIILVDGVPAGVYSIAEHSDQIFFSELQILPEYQREGLGTKIMKEQIQYARSLDLPLRLQVLRENKAQELYLRLGFVVTETTDAHVKMEWKE
jgi:GNAT superfamily N-acetyltransferase